MVNPVNLGGSIQQLANSLEDSSRKVELDLPKVAPVDFSADKVGGLRGQNTFPSPSKFYSLTLGRSEVLYPDDPDFHPFTLAIPKTDEERLALERRKLEHRDNKEKWRIEIAKYYTLEAKATRWARRIAGLPTEIAEDWSRKGSGLKKLAATEWRGAKNGPQNFAMGVVVVGEYGFMMLFGWTVPQQRDTYGIKIFDRGAKAIFTAEGRKALVHGVKDDMGRVLIAGDERGAELRAELGLSLLLPWVWASRLKKAAEVVDKAADLSRLANKANPSSENLGVSPFQDDLTPKRKAANEGPVSVAENQTCPIEVEVAQEATMQQAVGSEWTSMDASSPSTPANPVAMSQGKGDPSWLVRIKRNIDQGIRSLPSSQQAPYINRFHAASQRALDTLEEMMDYVQKIAKLPQELQVRYHQAFQKVNLEAADSSRIISRLDGDIEEIIACQKKLDNFPSNFPAELKARYQSALKNIDPESTDPARSVKEVQTNLDAIVDINASIDNLPAALRVPYRQRLYALEASATAIRDFRREVQGLLPRGWRYTSSGEVEGANALSGEMGALGEGRLR